MKKTASVIICILIILGLSVNSMAADSSAVNAVVTDTAKYIYKTVSNPQVGSVGGEWAVLGLARSGEEIPEEYYQSYYANVEKYVKACGGVLHDKKYTEYSRVIIALTAIGKNPADVAGYNLLTPLGDYEKTIWQGMNGPIWALLALDCGNYEMPQNENANIQATREMYINRILDCQLADGGWSLSGGTSSSQGEGVSDVDITGMALQALSKYQDNEKVREATEKALSCMSDRQNENGGFSGNNTENSENCAQMAVALCELGIPLDDLRFVKNGNTILDNLLSYYTEGSGFKHIKSGTGSSLMATEQGLYSMAAVKRAAEGKNSLYRMSDAIRVEDSTDVKTIGLENKNPEIKKTDILSPGKTFADVSNHKNQPAIEALAARNIINGKTEDIFEPDATMTRAEFAAIIVRGLGLEESDNSVFADVTKNDWFYGYVNTAYAYGIVNGISSNEFNPNGTISREEAAVMIARAAKLCGMNTEIETFEARNILAVFSDYVTAADWATGSLAFCYGEGILSDEAMEIKPKEAVKRAEIAQMLYNMLLYCELI